MISIRYSEDIISVWNKTAGDREITDRLRDCIKKILVLPGFVHMEYKPHETSLMDQSSFRNTQVWKPKGGVGSSGGGGGSSSGVGGSGIGDGGGLGSGSSRRSKSGSSSWGMKDSEGRSSSWRVAS